MAKRILENKMETIVCNHCKKEISSPALVGLTLVCPHCNKSVNGQYYHEFTNNQKVKNDRGGGLDGKKI